MSRYVMLPRWDGADVLIDTSQVIAIMEEGGRTMVWFAGPSAAVAMQGSPTEVAEVVQTARFAAGSPGAVGSYYNLDWLTHVEVQGPQMVGYLAGKLSLHLPGVEDLTAFHHILEEMNVKARARERGEDV